MDRRFVKHARHVPAAFLGLALVGAVPYATAATRTGASDDAVAFRALKATGLAAQGSTVRATASTPTTQPTWTALYRAYLAKGTVGDCASCHKEAATATLAYDWLAQQEYMTSSPPYLVDPRSSCFSWLGGDMPPDGPSTYGRARRDFETWAAAGASPE